jgi:putative phosphoesterase
MLIGLMSDTHDNLTMVGKAVAKFNEENVKLVLHAGDYVSPFVIQKFKPLKARMIGVFGNNDGDRELLKTRFKEDPNLEIRETFAKIEVDSIKIALTHGNDLELLDALINCSSFDIIAHGHAHMARVENRSDKLIVNPGEVCGYLTGRPTIALLDTEELLATIVTL